jgi:hypothetical protein
LALAVTQSSQLHLEWAAATTAEAFLARQVLIAGLRISDGDIIGQTVSRCLDAV